MVRFQWLPPKDRKRASCLSIMCALVAALLLSGCTGDERLDDPGVVPGDSSEEPPEEGGAAGGTVAPAHHFAPGDPAVVTVDESGVFGLAEYCFPVSCLLGGEDGDHRVEHDLSDDIPVGVPTTIELELTYDQEVMGGMMLSIEAEDAQVFHSWSNWDSGEAEVGMVLLRDDPGTTVAAVVHASTAGPPVETEWSLQGQIEADPIRLPSAVPVSIPFTGGTSGFVASAQEAESEFLVWDPQDVFLGRYGTEGGTHTFTAESKGDHVVMAVEGSLLLNATGEDPQQGRLTALPVSWEPVGDLQDLEPSGSTSWEFEVEDVPVAVGLRLIGDGLYLNTNMDVEVSSPEGILFEAELICGLCLSVTDGAPVYEQWSSGPGDPAHVPGTYTVEVELEAGAVLQGQAYLITYAR